MGLRKKLLGLGVIGLLVAVVAIYFLFFKDNAPASVDSVAAAEARQEAIAEAVAEETQSEDEPSEADNGESAEPADEGESVLDSGQPDSAASIGAATDGVWTIDTSIGTFDDACLTEACGTSFAGFRINEELANFGAKTVVGRTPGVSGAMELAGTQVIGAEFVVDMTQLITDNESRTGALRGPNGGIETDTFPEARFELTQPIELGSLPAEGVQISAQAVGNLTVHGVTNEVTIPLTAESQAGLIIVVGSLEDMLLADYGIPKPTAIVVVSVEEVATMELQLFFSR